MILVSRFVAEAIAELASDEDIIMDNDEHIEVKVSLSELDVDEIKAHVAHCHGNEEDACKDMEFSFGGEDMASKAQSTIYWKAYRA